MAEKSFQDIQKQRIKVDDLYSAGAPVVATSIIISTASAYLIKDHVNQATLIAWISVNLFFNILRIINFRLYKKSVINDDALKYWKMSYDLSTSVVSLTWAYFILNFFSILPNGSYLHSLFIMIFLAFVAGGVVVNVGSKIAAFSFPVSIVPTFIYVFAQTTDEGHIQLSVVGMFFGFLIVKAAQNIDNANERNLDLIFEKQSLINEVQEKYSIKKQLEREKIKGMNNSKLAALGEMASGVAHEINNPLMIISGTTWTIKKLLQDGHYDRIEKRIDKIDLTVTRISKIISTMRNLSRNSSGDSLSRITIGSIFDDTLPICTQKMFMKNIRFDQSELEKNFEIDCRPGEAGQVIINLLNNSIDELGELTVQRWIKVSSEVVGDKFLVKIIDAGLGVDEKVREKIFEPFYTQKELGKGTGLGLSLSKSIMKGFDGNLYIDGEAKNTTFVLEFPINVEEKKENDLDDDQVA